MKANRNKILNGRFLTERQKYIFKLRAEGRTLKEVGEGLGITKERVRQLEQKINEKIEFLEKHKSNG